VVLFDFAAEEEDEVAIVKGESLDVAYEAGGWLQVRHKACAVACGVTCQGCRVLGVAGKTVWCCQEGERLSSGLCKLSSLLWV
jgi:hypothetical protein